jgi:DNA-binding Lrp family transcriptional regulator
MGRKKGLDDKDMKLALMLAQGCRVSEIAVELGISTPAVYKRLSNGEIHTLVEELKLRGLSVALSLLQSEVGASVRKLVDIRDGAGVPVAIQRLAAKDILEMASVKDLTAPQSNPDDVSEYERATIGPDGVPRVKVGGRVKELPAPIEAEYAEVKS